MTHIVHPYAHRLGIIRDWRSRWFGRRGQYQEFLKADVLLREFLEKRLRGKYVEAIEMERGQNIFKIIIRTSRPGMIIGRAGEGTTKLKADINKFLRRHRLAAPKDLSIDIIEVKNPEASAAITAYMLAEMLEKRLPFRRALRQVLDKVMAARGVFGAKATISGRLGGAEMSRTETLQRGQMPLQTLRADIDFARDKAYLSYGVIGTKVWIYKGEIFDQPGAKAD